MAYPGSTVSVPFFPPEPTVLSEVQLLTSATWAQGSQAPPEILKLSVVFLFISSMHHSTNLFSPEINLPRSNSKPHIWKRGFSEIIVKTSCLLCLKNKQKKPLLNSKD